MRLAASLACMERRREGLFVVWQHWSFLRSNHGLPPLWLLRVLYLLAPALVLPVSVCLFLIARLVPELVVIGVVVDATGDSVLLALRSGAGSGDADVHTLPSITLVLLTSLLLLKTAAAACSQVGTLVTAKGIVGVVEGSVVVALGGRDPIFVSVVNVPARLLVIAMPISLSSLPLKTAASACAQVGTLAIAIPLIFLSVSAGMLRTTHNPLVCQ